MSDLEIWYAIPSANPSRAQECLEQWQAHGCRTAVALNKGMPQLQTADLHMWMDPYPGYFPTVNQMCMRILEEHSADIIITGGDDMYPSSAHTAQQIGKEFFERFPTLYGVMQPTGDRGIPGVDNICGSPWIGREFIRRAYGGKGPFWHQYFAYYGDEEMKCVAERLGVLQQRPDISQYHDHFSRAGGPPREPYQIRNEKFWIQDQNIFKHRAAHSFPGHEAIN